MNNTGAKRSKKKISKIMKNFLFGVGTLLMGTKAYFTGKTYLTENIIDNEIGENTVGFDNIGMKYNPCVHSNNFVILHVKDSIFNDVSSLKAKLDKCKELDISVGLVLDTNASNLSEIYRDVDYLQAIVKEYKIDLPIYCNIDNIMSNPNLNNAQRSEIIGAFVDKASRSDMYLGIYGSDSNLVDCDTYIFDLSDYDCYLVQDDYDIKYDGVTTIMRDLDGNVSAKEDLAQVIISKNLNNASRMVYSSQYEIKEGDTYHSLGLKFGLSERDIIDYNDGKKNLEVGDFIYIPNLYETVNTETNEVTYSYAVARGIDISDYQTNIDWDRVAETSQYVIVEVARDASDYQSHNGSFINESISQIENVVEQDISLGLYFCISKDMNVNSYEGRLENYFTKLESELSERNISLDKDSVPVFLDFEVFYSGNDYYRLMSTFENVCRSYGYDKVGIYGNGSTLNAINDSLVCDGKSLSLSDTNWYVWKSGGPQYSSRENTSLDDVSLSELVEVKNEVADGYMPVMQQVTNVCIDTGASNDMQHCDVSFLYDYSVFGDDFIDKVGTEYYAGTIEIDLDKYTNLHTAEVINCVDVGISAIYAICAIKIVGSKMFLALKNKIKEKKLTK